MASLRFTELHSRPLEFLDFTSLTLDEFQQLVSPFEDAFHARMAAWRMDGKPRTARRFTVYQNCPLLTPEDRLLFILVYLKTSTLQVVHGRLFGMVQGKANHNGSTSCCRHCSRRCAPSAMPPPARCRPWPSASASQRRTPPPSSRRRRRKPHPSSP